MAISIKKRFSCLLKISGTLAAILVTLPGLGQLPVLPTVPSPNAASLGQYGQIPVSNYTGTASVEIPIYTIEDTKLTIPVTLSYHTGGNRLESHPGWVGLGWNMNTGGAITRIMNRLPDELDAPTLPKSGFYYTHGDIDQTDWSSDANMKLPPPLRDIEPDIFTFNFLGMSGKFFLDEKGNWQVQSDQPLKVIFSPGDFLTPFISKYGYAFSAYLTPTFRKFTIIDQQGNQYIFGDTENAIEYSDDIAPKTGTAGAAFFATSWFLTKIIPAGGGSPVVYTYERGPYVSSLYVSTSLTSINGYWKEVLAPGCSSWTQSISTSGKVISPVYLKSISNPDRNIKINFSFSASHELTYKDADYNKIALERYGGVTRDYLKILQRLPAIIPYYRQNDEMALYRRFVWFKLDKVSVTDTLSRQIREVRFNYTDTSISRLELKALSFFSPGGSQPVQTYSFEYNTTKLPDYLASLGDHWGYHNNTAAPFNNQILNYEQLKAPSEGYTKARILEKITYPTGGTSNFEYNLHSYGSIVSNDRRSLVAQTGNASGLRVSKIRSTDAAGQTLTKEYFYVKNYTPSANPATLASSGILDTKPQYNFSVSGIDVGGAGFNYSMFSSSTVIPLAQNTSGISVGYSEVVERRSDGSYTIYQFTNHDNGYKDTAVVNSYNNTYTPAIPFTSYEFARGKPLRTTSYTATGSPVQMQQYSYAFVGSPWQQRGKAVFGSVLDICSGQVSSRRAVFKAAYYNLYCSLLADTVTETSYSTASGGTSVVIQNSFRYHPVYKQPLWKATRNSNGDTDSTFFKYPYDFGPQQPYQDMVAKNMLSPVIEQVQKVGNIQTVFTRTAFANAGGWPRPASVVLQNGSAPIDTIQWFKTYNLAGLPTEIQTTGGKKTAYAWAYNRFPIVELQNCPATGGTNYWYYQGFEENNYDASRPFAGKRYFTGDYQLTGLNLQAGTSYEVNYHYYENGVWKGKTVPYTPNMTLSDGSAVDEIRVYPTGALMTTRTCDPLLGITGQVNPDGRALTYRYDAYGRLALVVDQDGNIVRKICYNYNGQQEDCGPLVYKNQELSGIFDKTNCPADSSPDFSAAFTYTVNAGKYTSFLSQEDADQKASDDFWTNGPLLGNQYGKCMAKLEIRIKLKASIPGLNTKMVMYATDGVTKIVEADFPQNSDPFTSVVYLLLPASTAPGKLSGIIRFISTKYPPDYTYNSAVNYKYDIDPLGITLTTHEGSETNTELYVETGLLIFTKDNTYTITVSIP